MAGSIPALSAISLFKLIFDTMLQGELKRIPGIDKLLHEPSLKKLKEEVGDRLVTYALRKVIGNIRTNVIQGGEVNNTRRIVKKVVEVVNNIIGEKLKPVINATGIILHTNLGRAPLGKEILKELEPMITGYSNLEFNLHTCKRGERANHVKSLLTFITGGEDAVIVNNNAAAIFLILKTFAEKKEVIISRGELIEIGGSFRIPEIMIASGAKMVEVGTTNKTYIKDYENAITKKTRILFKAHKSNYFIGGYSEEVELLELSQLAKKHNLIVVFDAGSGFLNRYVHSKPLDEPDVYSSIKNGADLVTFSCDKLMGATQAGIITGKSELIKRLSKEPLMRTLRVDKITVAILNIILKFYLSEEALIKKSPVFIMINRKKEELFLLAQKIFEGLKENNIESEIVESKAQCGGGALPQLEFESFAVKVINGNAGRKFADTLFKSLLKYEKPVLGILREGEILFDVFTLQNGETEIIVEAVTKSIS